MYPHWRGHFYFKMKEEETIKKVSPSTAVIYGDANNATMKKLADTASTLLRVDDIVEGPVVTIKKSSLYVDLHPYGTGIIFGLEFIQARDIIKKINIGDMIKAKVTMRENENGYIELSLKEAKQAAIWSDAEEAIKNKTVMDLVVKEANKGGLILDWQGLSGFLPASQLAGDNYPRVADGDKEKILKELKKLIGKRISVCVIGAVPKEGKLIFSEKDVDQKERTEMIGKYTVGDEIEGTVTGIVDFGAFVKIEDGLEGLVHISEMAWSLIEDPKAIFKVGDKVKAKVIEIKDGKISLSVKALQENPWAAAENKYKKGDSVKGVVIKFNKHGALVSIEEGVAGLVHISEFGTEAKLKEALSLGKTYDFQISFFEPKEQRMTLTLGKK